MGLWSGSFNPFKNGIFGGGDPNIQKGSGTGPGIMQGASLGYQIGGPYGALGGGALGAIFGDKIFGVPSPPTAADISKDALEYYNTVFPGTTPWERLGTSSPTGAISSTSMQNQTSNRIANMSASNDMIMDRARLSLENKRIDTDAGLRSRELDLREQELPASIQAKRYGSIPSAIKSTADVAGDIVGKYSFPSTVMGIKQRMDTIRTLERKIKSLKSQGKVPRNYKGEPYSKSKSNRNIYKGRSISVRNFN